MGCFNVACTVSNLSIGHGDEVVFIPLKAEEDYESSNNLNERLTNDHMLIYSDCLYKPTMLPIKGEYNDYGSIENIIRDENVIHLEKVYGISIEKIIDILTDFDSIDLEKENNKIDSLKTMSGMFVHRKIYNSLITMKHNSEDVNLVDLMNGDTFIKNSNEIYDSIQIKNILEKKPKYKDMIKEEPILNMLVSSSIRKLYNNEWEEFGENYPILMFTEGENKKLFDNLLIFQYFSNSMYSVNSYYSPAMNGEQHGNRKASKFLYEESINIMNHSDENENYPTNIVDLYINEKDLNKCIEKVNKDLEYWTEEYVIDFCGLSSYEFDLFKKDNNNLKDILDYYSNN